MAVNFGLINQGPTFAESFLAGQEAVRAEQDRNLLRQAQMEQMAAQRENMLAQRAQRMEEAEARRRAGEAQNALATYAASGQPMTPSALARFGEPGIKLAEALRKQQADQVEQEIKVLDYATRRLAAANPQTYPAIRADLARINPQFAAGLPEQFDAEQVMSLARQGLSLKEQIESATRETVVPLGATLVRGGKPIYTAPEKAPEPTAGMREYQEAVRQGFKGTFMEYKQSLAPKPPQVNVKLPEQEKAFETGLGRAQAERIMEDQKVAQDARSIIDTVQQGRQLLRSGAITGFGAEALTQIGAALNQIGINFAEDAVANTQAFASNMAQNVGRIIKQFGAGTGLSNADREYAEKMAGGKITLDRKAIERILDINERAARNVIVSHNKRVQGIKTNVPLTVEMPSGPPAPAPIPGAPAAAAPAAAPAAARQVRRTGTLNGRRVIEYTDGSVEYAN